MPSGAACTGSNLGKANRSLRLNLVQGKEREDPPAFPLAVSLLRLASHGEGCFCISLVAAGCSTTGREKKSLLKIIFAIADSEV